MEYNKKQKSKAKLIASKIHSFKRGDFLDLSAISKDFYALAESLNKQILAIEKKITRDETIRCCLEHKKFFFGYTGLYNKVAVLKFITYDGTKGTTKDLENYKFYKELKAEVDLRIDSALKNNRELNILKYRQHNIYSILNDGNYIQDKRGSGSKYDNLPFEKLIEMFDTSTFYQLSSMDIVHLCQTVANSYFKMMNVKSAPVIFVDKKDRSLGSYIRFGNYVELNLKYLQAIDKFRANNQTNPLLQYKLLETILHECRHSYQSVNKSEDKTIKYITNASRINTHYMSRIFYSNEPYPENPNPGYHSRIQELDAFNASKKMLLDISKLNIKNAKEVEMFIMYSIANSKYKANNSTIKEMIELANNYGLTNNLAQMMYQNMQFLGMTTKNTLVMVDGKINYPLSVEKCVKTINDFRLKAAFDNEKHIRETLFDVLFNADKYVEEYALKSNMSAKEYKDMLASIFKEPEQEIRKVEYDIEAMGYSKITIGTELESQTIQCEIKLDNTQTYQSSTDTSQENTNQTLEFNYPKIEEMDNSQTMLDED